MTTHDVVVVGAGPAGLTAAITLARLGIDCLVLERRPGLSALPRATAVSLRTMERLRSWGLEAEVRAGGDDVEFMLLDCENLAAASRGRTVDVGYPTRAQSALISPTSPGCVPQDHLESVLLRHLQLLPAARAEFGVTVAAVDAADPGARVVLSDGRVIETRYVIAADGAHSAVRNSLGIPMEGPDRLTQGIAVQFRAPLWEVVGPHRYGIYNITDAGVPCVLLPAGQGDRWICGIEWDPDTERLADYTPTRLVAIVRRAAGLGERAPRIERVGSFSFAAQIAPRFRSGDVFLVGDAAHRVTPRGGTGMNTAIAGAFDLAWRLAWVLKDWADRSLLDGYERERRPLAEHNLTRSAAPDGSRRDTQTELRVDLAGRIPHHWVTTPTGPVSTLDFVGDGLTIFAGPDGDAWIRAAASVPLGLSLIACNLDHVSARALGVLGSGSLLVRPDGVPVAAWPDSASATVRMQEVVAAIAGCAPERTAA